MLYPGPIPAHPWVPAFAGMTVEGWAVATRADAPGLAHPWPFPSLALPIPGFPLSRE